MAIEDSTPSHAVPLDRVAGLDGFLREWSVQALPTSDTETVMWKPVPIRNDFGLWLRRDPRLEPYRERGMRLRALVHAPEARRCTLVLNAFAGCRVVIDDGPLPPRPPAESYAFDDLRYGLKLEAGTHSIVLEIAAADVPPVFAARMVTSNGLAQMAEGDEGDADAEAFRYYNARCSAHHRPRETWRGRADVLAWRDRFRTAFAALMPPPPGADDVPLDPEVVERVELDDHVRETVRITVEPGWRTDVYVLRPHAKPGSAGPWPGLLCLHGHGRGKDDLVGIDRGDPARRAAIDSLHEDYALRYVRRGYVTATPGMRLLADRGIPRWGQRGRDPCDNGYAQATMCGLVPAALDAWDARRALDLLASLPEVATDAEGPRLGCVGLSYGGRATMNVTALDDRIRAAVVSGAMNCFQERLVSFAGCGSQFVPGLFTIGDTPEIMASIAPRPLLLELGSRDGTSPAIFAEDMEATLRAAYQAHGAGDRLAFDVFEGEHWYSGRRADSWLDRWLR